MINLNTAIFKQFSLIAAPSPRPDIGLYYCPLSTISLNDDRLVFLTTLLTTSELAHRQAYRTATLKANAILSRGLLRLILAAYLTEPDAKKIALTQHPLGKPYLLNGRLQFSVSHCDSMLMIAISQTRLIGIDIEGMDQHHQDDLAGYVLSTNESAIHHQLPQDAKAAYFLHCWTRKEAYLKAVGTGLVNHLHQVDTSGDHIVDQGRITPYQIMAIDINPYHIASLAYAWTHHTLPSLLSQSKAYQKQPSR